MSGCESVSVYKSELYIVRVFMCDCVCRCASVCVIGCNSDVVFVCALCVRECALQGLRVCVSVGGCVTVCECVCWCICLSACVIYICECVLVCDGVSKCECV